MPEVVVTLQEAIRGDLKDAMGPIYQDADALLASAGRPVVSVGDVVTYHLLGAGHVPRTAVVDDRTERSAVDAEIAEAIRGFDRTVDLENPAATLTAELLAELAAAIHEEVCTLLQVDGEEDLATLPAIVVAPAGASVVYGQPGEGMVLVQVDEDARDRAFNVLERMEGDTPRLRSLLDRE